MENNLVYSANRRSLSVAQRRELVLRWIVATGLAACALVVVGHRLIGWPQ